MYHTKEILNMTSPLDLRFEPEEVRVEVPLQTIRFGELPISAKFFYQGNALIKTGEYNAVSNRKQGKRDFMFFKKDLVQVNTDSLNDKLFSKSADLADIQPMSKEAMKVFDFNKKMVNPKNKYDLFEDHTLLMDKEEMNKESKFSYRVGAAINIETTPEPRLCVSEEGKITQVVANLPKEISSPWRVPLKIQGIDFDLDYNGSRFELRYQDNPVWRESFTHDWKYVHCCSIKVNCTLNPVG